MSEYDQSEQHESFVFDAKRPQDFVDAWLHGVLEEADAVVVERWCQTTPEGRQALQMARQRKLLLESVGQSQPSAELMEATLAQFSPKVERSPRRWRRFRQLLIGATAATIALIASVQSYYVFMKPTPYDVRVVGQSEWMAGSLASMQIVVRDLQQDALLHDVPCRLQLFNPRNKEQITLASFRSGDRLPQFEIPDWEAGRYELRLQAMLDGREEMVTHTIELTRPWRLLLTTDKPMYQPGQTIHLRCQALRRPQLTPLANERVIFRIKDSQGNVILKNEATTSRFGIASTDCPLAREIELGTYQIECEVGSTTSLRTITVDRYVLPKIKVDISLDQSYYLPGDTVNVDVNGSYIFGKPIPDGEVELILEADGLNVDFDQPLKEPLDEAGHATFTFQLPKVLVGRPEEHGIARVRAIAVVRDPVGQELAGEVAFPVSPSPLIVELISETPTPVLGVPNQVYVSTSYPDGRPAAAKVAINGDLATLETNSLGTGRFQLVPDAAEIRLTAVAEDAAGRVGRATAQWTVSQQSNAYLVRTDRAIYQSGETALISIVAGGVEPVFVDLIKDDQTVFSRIVAIEEGRGSLEIDLPIEIFGTLRLETYRLARSGLAARRTQVIVVKPNEQINIETTFDRSNYRPGETADVEIRLTDEHGSPRPGAIGLSVVDEALYSLLRSRAGMERSFFLLEQDLLRPVYAIYDRWGLDDAPPNAAADEPVVEEQRLWQQALFARTVSQIDHGQLASRKSVEPRSSSDADPVSYTNPYSLDQGNFETKLQRVEATREAGLSYCKIAWIALVLAVGVALSAAFAVAYPRVFAIAAGVVAIGGAIAGSLVFMMFMMVGREAAMESQSAAGGEIDFASSDARPMSGAAAGDKNAPRVRRDFPETLYWQPELITDDQGVASFSLPLADSITTWRMMLSAVDETGRLGASESQLVVFQPFQVDVDAPVSLVRGDEYELPIVVYNFSDQPQRVHLEVQAAAGLQPVGGESDLESRLIEAGDVAAWPYRVRATQVGQFALQVIAHGDTAQDAIERTIEVIPNGRRVERALSRRVGETAEFEVQWPIQRVPDSQTALIQFFPSTFSEIVNGIDAIFRRPTGCFEQTSSSTYPNVLALKYLRDQQLELPEVEAKARQYIHLGYQRLLSFEVPGGGFDWYGRAPASVSLTAYGLQEFKDMAAVHDVDPRLIERTESWLWKQRRADGSWQPESHRPGWIASTDSVELDTVLLTSHLAWALYEGRPRDARAQLTEDFLLSFPASSLKDPYLIALMIQSLAAMECDPQDIQPYVDQLVELQSGGDNELVYWHRPGDRPNLMFSRGQSGQVEVTALAILALIRVGQRTDLVGNALAWIATQKDPEGTWGSTHATILALKALIGGTNVAAAMHESRTIEILVDGMVVQRLEIPPSQAEVVQMVNLTDALSERDSHRLQIRQSSQQAMVCCVTLRHYIENIAEQQGESALAIDVQYDKTRLEVDETLSAEVTVENRMEQAAPMVMLDLPIPAGFQVRLEDWDSALESGLIGKYEVTARQIIVYLRQLEPGRELKLNYRMKATTPVRLSVPPGEAYEYYTPERRAAGGAVEIKVE